MARWGMVIDLDKCTGCQACTVACKEENNVPYGSPKENRERTEIYWNKVIAASSGEYPSANIEMIPMPCMHCDNPACATICPFSANHKNENGAVVINQNQCFGGAKCKDVCPWEIPQRQSGVGVYLHVLPGLMGNGVMYKCDLCNDRLKEGKLPGCVEACPHKAMLIGPKKDMEKLAGERARQIKGYIYGKTENGGTSTLYVSPVSFELINKTMPKKPGQPDMKPEVERRMAGTDNLGKAVLAAPVLGLAAAGAFGWFSRRKELVKKEEKDNG